MTVNLQERQYRSSPASSSLWSEDIDGNETPYETIDLVHIPSRTPLDFSGNDILDSETTISQISCRSSTPTVFSHPSNSFYAPLQVERTSNHSPSQEQVSEATSVPSAWARRAASCLLSPRSAFKTFNSEECPKEVSSNRARLVLSHFALYHLPAIGITFTLLALYFAEVEWAPSHPTPNELSALQYLAKAHESFILVSIMDIMLHRIQFNLLEGNGMQLGFITSAFHLGSPVYYLTSWELWATIFNPSKERFSHAINSLLILFLLILGLGAAPFSATAMVPRQGWWEAARSSNANWANYIHGNPYPLNLSQKNAFSCNIPDIDLQQMFQALKAAAFNSLPVVPLVANVSYDTSSLTDNRPVSLTVDNIGSSALSFATCPMGFVAESLRSQDKLPRKLENKTVLVKARTGNLDTFGGLWSQPLVAVECLSNSTYLGLPAPFIFNGLYENYTVDLRSYVEIENLKSQTKNKGSSGTLDPIFLKPPPERSQLRSTAILLPTFQTFNESDIDLKLTPEKKEFIEFEFTLCLVQARWIEAEVSQERQEIYRKLNQGSTHYYLSSNTQSNLGFSAKDTTQYMKRTSTVDNIIILQESYLQAISIPFNGTLDTKANPIFTEANRFCHFELPHVSNMGNENCISMSLSVYLADALGRSITSREWLSTPSLAGASNPVYPRPGSGDNIIKLTYSTFSYAYRLQNSTTIILALSGLMLHVCIVLVHLTIILASRRPWFGISWGSFGQMLALALQSKAPEELRNISGGVSSSQTWSRNMIIRHIKDEGRLHLMVDPKTEIDQAQDDWDITSDRDDTSDQLDYAKPGLKYR